MKIAFLNLRTFSKNLYRIKISNKKIKKELKEMTKEEQEIMRIKAEAVNNYIRAKNAEEREDALSEHGSPYKKGWIQVNKASRGKILWLIKHHKSAYCLLSFLILHMDKENVVITSYNVIQEALEMSRNTISNGIKILSEYNFIYTYKVGTATAYATNAEVAWTTYGKNERYAKLKGNILIAESEQPQTVIKKNNTVEIGKEYNTKTERKRKN